MKTYVGGGCIDSHFLDLGTSWRWTVSFTFRPLYPRKRTPGTHWIGLVNTRAGLDDVEKRKFLTLPGRELRLLDRPARSQLLYRLGYHGFRDVVVSIKLGMDKIESRYSNFKQHVTQSPKKKFLKSRLSLFLSIVNIVDRTSCTLRVCTTWRWVVSFTLQPLYLYKFTTSNCST
jgi:hypothetical protein